MTQIQNRFFFHKFADLAFIPAAKSLETQKNCPKIVYGKIGAVVWKPCATTNRIPGEILGFFHWRFFLIN